MGVVSPNKANRHIDLFRCTIFTVLHSSVTKVVRRTAKWMELVNHGAYKQRVQMGFTFGTSWPNMESTLR